MFLTSWTVVLESGTEFSVNSVPDQNAKLAAMGLASESDGRVAVEREAVIRPLSERGRLAQASVEDAVHRLGVSRTLIYRLVGRYRQRPQTSSLLPWKRGRARKTRFLGPAREELISACIKECYLVPERPSLAILFREVKRRFAERHLPPPNYRSLG